MKRLAIAVSALTLGVAALSAPAMVSAWGNTGHRLIGVAAVRGLPEELPAFLRTPGAAATPIRRWPGLPQAETMAGADRAATLRVRADTAMARRFMGRLRRMTPLL